MRGLVGASFASLLGLLICVIPAVVALRFLARPSERLLAMLRPLTIGALFAALCSLLLAIANGFVAVSMMKGFDLQSVQTVGAVFMEGLAPVVLSFASLSAAWFLVAIGMRRS